MNKARKRLAERLAAQEIRIDEHHTIKLRTSRWFPELIVTAGLIATAGTYFYGKQIGLIANVTAEARQTGASVLTAPLEIEQEKALEAQTAPALPPNSLSAAPRPKASLNPRITEATTRNKAISVDLDSAQIVGDEAVITYRIYNRGRDQVSGSTWAKVEQKGDAGADKLSWQAKRFTVKQVTVPAAAGEAKIFVSAAGAEATNTYVIKF